MSNSGLVSYTKLSPNCSSREGNEIYIFTPHCFVGQVTVEQIGACFARKSREASCNYGIGKDGRIALIVEEKYRSWCTSSKWNDQRGITIECASDATKPWAYNKVVYQSLVNLLVDCCKRNGKNKVVYLGTLAKTQAYKRKSNEMLITEHRWYAAKACPGDWMHNRLQQLTNDANKILSGQPQPTPTPTPPTPTPTTNFKVKVTVKNLNIRKGPGTNYAKVGVIKPGVYTIVETSSGQGSKSGWGKLKSGVGWISLDYVTKL